MKKVDFARFDALLARPDVLSGVFDELPFGVALLDERGAVVRVNSAYETLTGVDRTRIAGLGCLHALRCDFCVKGCPVAAGVGDFDPVSVDANIINRERRKVAVRVTVAPLMDENGVRVGTVETVTSASQAAPDEPGGGSYALGGLVGKSPGIQKLFNMVPSVAQTDSSVLITGETGTGKDILAEEIHKASDRAGGPFIKVNCGALPDTLMESELFGHAKGAFTGADQNKPGRFRLAHGGTLFLTEIGDLPINLQVKLLSFLDDKVIYPLGSTKGFHADVRVIVATHRDLEQMVAQGRFRQDLLYRLNVIRFHLPPLRERGEDVFLLMDHFLKMFQARFNKRIEGFSEAALALLHTYAYPGNVRELRNVIEYAVNFCDGKRVRMRHLPAYLSHVPTRSEHEAEPLLHAHPEAMPAMQSAPAVDPGEARNWEDVERRMIMNALIKAGGKRIRAAEILGWGRSTLWRKMKQYGIR